MGDESRVIVLVDPVASGTPFLEAAKRRHFEIIALMTLPPTMIDRLGGGVHALADHVLMAKTTDEAVVQLEHFIGRIAAVVPTTEPSVDIAEALQRRLGLPGNVHLPGARRDKGLMREVVRAYGLRVPEFRRCSTWEEVSDFVRHHPLPLVIKTPRGAGATHVYICRDPEQLKNSFERTLAGENPFGERSSSVIVEEYIEGREVAVNLFAMNEDIRLIDVWSYDKVETSGGSSIYLGALQCDREDPSLSAAIEYAVDVCRAVRIGTGPAHVEIKIDKKGPVLVEVAARLVGGRISELWDRFSNFAPFDTTLSAFLGEVMSLSPVIFTKRLAVAYCPVWRDIPNVTRIKGASEFKSLPSYVTHQVFVREGIPFGPTHDLETLAAAVWLAHERPSQLMKDMLEVPALFEAK